jgi:sulfite reductase alpha subunit-like flavoprotein
MGKALDEKLGQIGGQRISPLACADDATCLDDVVEPWLEAFWGLVKAAQSQQQPQELPPQAPQTPSSSATTSSTLYPEPTRRPGLFSPSATVHPDAIATFFDNSSRNNRTMSEMSEGEPPGTPMSRSVALRLRVQAVLCEPGDSSSSSSSGGGIPWGCKDGEHAVAVAAVSQLARGVLKVTLDLPSDLSHTPGDAVTIKVPAPPEVVDAVLAKVGATGATLVTISALPTHPYPSHLPEQGVTLRLADVLSQLDLLGRPTRSHLRDLATVAVDEAAREALLARSDAPRAIRGSWHSALSLCSALPAALVLSMIPPSQPRWFSIATGTQPGPIVLAVGLQEGGLASRYFSSRLHHDGGGKLVVAVPQRLNGFTLPLPIVPVVMVCAGTGVAPFRAFVEARALAVSSGQAPYAAEMLLFVGAKTRSEVLFLSEFEAWREAGVLSGLFVAESAPEGGDKNKTYVQDTLAAEARSSKATKRILLNPTTHLFVCGNGNTMAKGVHATLLSLFAELGGMTPDEAEKSLNAMREQGRYIRDVWSAN